MKKITFLSVFILSSFICFGQAQRNLGYDTLTGLPIVRNDTVKKLNLDPTLKKISEDSYQVTIGVNGTVGSGSIGGWQLTGNTAAAGRQTGSFLGTTNNVTLRFKRNNADAGGIDSATGNWFTDSTAEAVAKSNTGYRVVSGGSFYSIGAGSVGYWIQSGHAIRSVSNSGTIYFDGGPDLGGNLIFRANYYRYTGSSYFGSTFVTPTSTVHVGGSFAVPITSIQPTAITHAYTIQPGDHTVLLDASLSSTGDCQAILPTAVGITGRIYVVKKIDVSGNTVTPVTNSSQTIDGVSASTFVLATRGKFLQLQSDGAGWVIIGQN